MRAERFARGLAEILGASANSITPVTELNEQNWDSVVVISAIALIDDVYGITVPAEKLARCRSVGELIALVNPTPMDE